MSKRQEPIALKTNLYDKFVAYFSPKTALRNAQARTMYALAGGYSGAKRNRAALSNWDTSAGSAESDISPDLPMLRFRNRDLTRNNPVAGGTLGQVTTSVIGTGLSMQPSPNAKLLKLTEAQLKEWVSTVKFEWSLFAGSKDCDIERQQNFYQLQDLVFRSRWESGDVFVLTPRKPRGNTYDLVLQVIEADRVSNPNRQMNTPTLIDGIEVDEDGAPIRCYISKFHPGDMKLTGQSWTAYPFYGANNRRNVLHLMKKLRPGQKRGVPDFAAIIEPLKQLGRYTEAELQAAVTSGMFSIFVTMDPEAFDDLFDDTGKKTYVQNAGKWNGNLDSGGRAVNLLPGEDVKAPNPGRPNAEFDPFVQSILRQVGINLEIPYEVLIQHFQSSYSAARAAILAAWRTYRKWRDWMATDFCQPVYELWLEEAVAKGRISAPGFFANPAIRAAWCGAIWVGDGPGSIDPVKDADAAKKRVDLTISTLEQESVLHDGIDWETKVQQRAKENEIIRAAGLGGPTVPDQSVTEPVKSSDPEEKEDQ
jgi:lambda family phage portal protein